MKKLILTVILAAITILGFSQDTLFLTSNKQEALEVDPVVDTFSHNSFALEVHKSGYMLKVSQGKDTSVYYIKDAVSTSQSLDQDSTMIIWSAVNSKDSSEVQIYTIFKDDYIVIIGVGKGNKAVLYFIDKSEAKKD